MDPKKKVPVKLATNSLIPSPHEGNVYGLTIWFLWVFSLCVALRNLHVNRFALFLLQIYSQFISAGFKHGTFRLPYISYYTHSSTISNLNYLSCPQPAFILTSESTRSVSHSCWIFLQSLTGPFPLLQWFLRSWLHYCINLSWFFVFSFCLVLALNLLVCNPFFTQTSGYF